uniref:Uncharacterized protein n=1 Tax=viral metagenome TaxID=1070528 RepID=A0A6C0DKS4_9ZZZZ
MNIVIVEQLNKAIKQSNDLLKATKEQSLKRRHQLETYSSILKTTWYKEIINTVKTYWYC